MKRIAQKNKKQHEKKETCSIVLKPVTSVAVAPVRSEGVSVEALLASVPRASRFLTAVQFYPGLFDRLEPAGLTREELAEGWSLLRFDVEHPPSPPRVQEKASAAGITGCEAFLEHEVALARGQLSLRFPDQLAFLFEGIDDDARGVEAVITASLFASRCRQLGHAPERAAVRDRDEEAVVALRTVGVTPERLDAVDDLAALARRLDPQLPPMSTTWEEQRLAVLRKLHTWITVWSEQGRRVLVRKDDLQRLGILKRHHRKPKPALAPLARSVEEEGPDSRAA